MISEEIHLITSSLPDGVRLVAVSKYHPSEAIREAFAAGQRLFGESHAQELQRKHQELADLATPSAEATSPLQWHFIGHLQTNKVKYIAPYVSLIHSVDSPRLLAEVDKQAQKAGRVVSCLLQLHVAQEETKFGFTPDEARAYLESGEWQALQHIQLAGVMAMATNTSDTSRIRRDFHSARLFFEEAQRTFFPPIGPDHSSPFSELSMGMSDDWHIAVDEGSTLIRIGTRIFGERQY
ncbi:MAG: YggS family pyridoxal phosphate-dependent enzyme [Bacteroidaceae bacterium]|nr:YggS family pyridoxal phosphate-dependent enzyme [Bacteroidaceae bacterium]